MAQSLTQGRESTTGKAITKKRAKGHGRHWFWGVLFFLLLLPCLAVLAAAGLVTAYEFKHAQLIYPGVQVGSLPLGGLSVVEAERGISEALTPIAGVPVTLRYGDRQWSLAPANLGVSVDSRAMAAQAFTVGRTGQHISATEPGLPGSLKAQWQGLLADLMTQLDAVRYGHEIPMRLKVDESKVTYTLMRVAREVDVPPQEASLVISGLDVMASPGRAGLQVDVNATRAAVIDAALSGQGGEVALVVHERPPMVSTVDEAAAKATGLLAQPLVLIAQGAAGEQRFTVERSTLAQWLRITPVATTASMVDVQVEMDREAVAAYLTEIANQIRQPAQDARLDFDPASGQISVLAPSQVGQELDVNASVENITAALAGGVFENTTSPREIGIQISLVQPRIDSNKTAEMGIVELVSEGSSSFAGSKPERVHNIVAAADKFQHVVIPPGEEFSFNKYVGDITIENGFVEGLVIGAERTAVGIGGGVCQVSTTVFRAALNGGFPITQRYAHGYVVSWYGKPGLDATIYTPTVDFRFLNDTDHFIFVKPTVDIEAGRITFSIYGTQPGRTVEIDEPIITNVVPAPKPLYQEDPSLAAGTIKQVDWAVNGQDALVVRRIRFADGQVREERFESRYRPWRAVFLYGPGTQLPAGAVD